MVDDVKETGEGRIGVMQQPVARIFGQVQGQRAVRAEQAEEAHFDDRRPGIARRPYARERCRREIQQRLLA